MNVKLMALRAAAAVIAVALIVAAYFSYMAPEEPKPLLRLDTPQPQTSPANQGSQRQMPPKDEGLNFTAPTLDGRNIHLSAYRGHPVIVDFWATWCGPCRRQIPELVSLYRKYNKSRGLVIIGVSCDLIQGDGVKAVAPFVEEFQIDYPIALADERLVDKMGVEAIPTTLFVSPKGELVSRIVGAGHAGEISASAMALLDGVKGPASPSKPTDINGHVVDISVVY
jgi:thiol-disulfide isomerase/thioredoxin